jgi:protein-S-isoprenylcysteine O-methyltransferase Ste14
MRTGIPPLVLAGLLAIAMWLVARCLPQGAFDLPFRQAAAAVIGSAALVILALAVRPFRHARTTVDPRRPERASALVTDGVYSLSRNPMYVGMVLALIAWGLWLASVVALLLAPPAFVIYMDRRQIPAEEHALAAAFGEHYAQYTRRVRRWI